jgi:hypothetical protein
VGVVFVLVEDDAAEGDGEAPNRDVKSVDLRST